MPDPLADFTAYHHPRAGHPEARTVYVRGPENAPRVVLLHELPGMVPQCVELARRLSGPGRKSTPYQVHMPLLFGAAAQQVGSYREQAWNLWCIRKEFELFRTNRVSPITSWVGSLTAKLSGPGHIKVGVIGMCLTGGLVLGLIDDPTVSAVVASQPSLPLGITPKRRRAVGIPQEALSRAAAESTTPVLAARYRKDPFCPRGRLTSLVAAYGAELPEPDPGGHQDLTFGPLRVLDINGRGHALLTLDLSPVALRALHEFLDTHLSE